METNKISKNRKVKINDGIPNSMKFHGVIKKYF